MNCRLSEMFEYQKNLMEKKYPQHKPGSCSDVSYGGSQVVIREYAGWIMEELAEAIHELYGAEITLPERCKEELINGLHFIIELSIIIGVGVRYIVEPSERDDINSIDFLEELYRQNKSNGSINGLITEFVYDLGMFTHCLKNKPWKMVYVLTNGKDFYGYFQRMVGDWFSIMSKFMDADEIYKMFVNK